MLVQFGDAVGQADAAGAILALAVPAAAILDGVGHVDPGQPGRDGLGGIVGGGVEGSQGTDRIIEGCRGGLAQHVLEVIGGIPLLHLLHQPLGGLLGCLDMESGKLMLQHRGGRCRLHPGAEPVAQGEVIDGRAEGLLKQFHPQAQGEDLGDGLGARQVADKAAIQVGHTMALISPRAASASVRSLTWGR